MAVNLTPPHVPHFERRIRPDTPEGDNHVARCRIGAQHQAVDALLLSYIEGATTNLQPKALHGCLRGAHERDCQRTRNPFELVDAMNQFAVVLNRRGTTLRKQLSELNL